MDEKSNISKIHAPIYYFSAEHVKQLYLSLLGSNSVEVITKEKRKNASLSLKAKISKVIQVIIGADLEGETKFGLSSSTTNTVTIENTIEKKALNIVEHLISEDIAANVKDLINVDGTTQILYQYSLPTSLSPKIINKTESIISVCCQGQKIKVHGLTSVENWCSTSSKNNLILASKRAANKSIPTFGLFYPLSVWKDQEITNIQAQFLMIAHQNYRREK